MNIKLLDCTLRDGGYYTNWDFDDDLIAEYAAGMEALPIEFVEVGYRSLPKKGYLGKYFYCPEYVLKNLKELMPSKQLVIILDEKDVTVAQIEDGLLNACKAYVSMIRIAIDPKNMGRAILLAKKVKSEGFKVAFNVMYMSSWKADPSFLDKLEDVENTIDYFYMVDSYGGVFPEDVKQTIALVKSKTNVPLGFHGHDNLEMALINTITAIQEGCEVIDATVTGMGRGAGNLKTELLLTYLENSQGLSVDFTSLSNVVSDFEVLRQYFNWGTSLPYMFSGAKSLPQKDVMEWVGLNRYPLGSILNALHNQKQELKDNLKLPILEKSKKYSKAIIIGGGNTARKHLTSIKKLINESANTCLIHAGTRNVSDYLDIDHDQYYGLVGFESVKLLKQIGDFSKISQKCVYPPFPRAMGTVIPNAILNLCSELEKISFTNSNVDSPMALAIQTALDLGANELMLAGFDGYDNLIDQNQFTMARENQEIINDALTLKDVKLFSITPTKYKNIEVISIYSLL